MDVKSVINHVCKIKNLVQGLVSKEKYMEEVSKWTVTMPPALRQNIMIHYDHYYQRALDQLKRERVSHILAAVEDSLVGIQSANILTRYQELKFKLLLEETTLSYGLRAFPAINLLVVSNSMLIDDGYSGYITYLLPASNYMKLFMTRRQLVIAEHTILKGNSIFIVPPPTEITNVISNIVDISCTDMKDLIGLEKIDLSQCGIESLDIDTNSLIGLKNLSILNLSNCKINDFAQVVLTNCTNLFSLNLSNNKLKQVPTHYPSSLICLDLSNNQIKESILIETWKDLSNLQTVNLSGNGLVVIPEQAISEMFKLRELNLSKNCISSISRKIPKLTLLKRLDLSHNYMDDADLNKFSQLKRLVSLDLSHNKIVVVTTKDDILTDLEVLNLSNNKINTFPYFMKHITNRLLLIADYSNNLELQAPTIPERP